MSREIQKLVPYDRAAINLLQKDENYFSVYAEESRLPASAIPEGVSVREGTATGWVLDHKEPLICRDVLKDPGFPLTHKRYKNVGLRSYVILPLMAKGRVLGVLNLGSLKPGRYGKKEIEILSPVAEILSLAIENSNLYEESQRREEIQKLLKELSQDITSLDIDSLFKKLTEKIREVFKVDVCDVRLMERGVWRSVGVSGIDPDRLRLGTTGTARGRSRWVIENRKPLLIPDMNRETNLPTGEILSRLGFRGYLGVPLLSRGGEVVGVLRALTYQPREFTQEEVDLLQQLVNGVAIALENARLFEEVGRKSRELESLIKVNRAMAALLDRKTLLPRIAEEARSLIQMDVASFRLIEGDSMVRVGYAGDKDLLDLRPKMQLGESITGRIIREARPIAIKHIQDEPTIIEEHREVYRKWGYHSFLGVPLLVGGRIIGTINLYSKEERDFRPEEINLISAFADQAAIAIENARLFEEVQKKSQELEDAYKTKSDFFNTMAHELRTPLNVLVATLQLFTEGVYGELSEKQLKGFEPMQRNAMNLLNLISSILDLARLEAKRVPLQIEDFSLKEITDELESSLLPLAKEKGLDLRLQIDDPTLRLKSDKSKIKMIFQNLLGNAVKYTDKGEIELRISPVQDHRNGSDRETMSIVIKDTGIGIKEVDLPHIFEAFYMAEGVSRRKYPGSGLGLSIVKRLLELLHGDIQVQSEWGKGSTFTATLPLVHLNES